MTNYYIIVNHYYDTLGYQTGKDIQVHLFTSVEKAKKYLQKNSWRKLSPEEQDQYFRHVDLMVADDDPLEYIHSSSNMELSNGFTTAFIMELHLKD